MDISLGKEFSKLTLKVPFIKGNFDKLELIKIMSVKEPFMRMKRMATDWGKYLQITYLKKTSINI